MYLTGNITDASMEIVWAVLGLALLILYLHLGAKITGLRKEQLFCDNVDDIARVMDTIVWPLYLFWYCVNMCMYAAEYGYLYLRYSKKVKKS